MDQAVWQFFIDHRIDALNQPQVWISDAFQPRWVVLMVLLITAVLGWRTRHLPDQMRWAKTLFPAAALLSAIIISTALKHLLGRARPPEELRLVVETNPSMPSGHALAVCALATVLSILLRALGRHILWVLAAWLAAILVCVNRLYVGVHWFSDVLVGGLIGVFVTVAVWQLLRRFMDARASEPFANTDWAKYGQSD